MPTDDTTEQPMTRLRFASAAALLAASAARWSAHNTSCVAAERMGEPISRSVVLSFCEEIECQMAMMRLEVQRAGAGFEDEE